MAEKQRRFPLYQQTLVAIILGVLTGMLLGPRAAWFGAAGKVIITLIKTFATPLLFFTIVESILQAEFRRSGIAWMLLVSAIDGFLAVLISFGLFNFFRPGAALGGMLKTTEPAAPLHGIDWSKALDTFIPDSIVGPFFTNAIPAVILLAIAFASAMRTLEKRQALPQAQFEALRSGARFLVEMQVVIIEAIVRLIPIAVFTAVAKVVGEHGFALFQALSAYVGICIAGMVLQIVLVYQTWVSLIARIPLRTFWREVKEPAVYAFGINSSLATLQFSLAALDRLGVSKASARLAACVGTNFNNDGVLLYEVFAALFIAQAHGIDLSLGQQLTVAATCVLATVGVAGIPEAGIISLTLVLSTTGLPFEGLALLLTVDWCLARCRSLTNVLSDITVAVAVDHFARPAPAPLVARK